MVSIWRCRRWCVDTAPRISGGEIRKIGFCTEFAELAMTDSPDFKEKLFDRGPNQYERCERSKEGDTIGREGEQ